MTILCSCQRSGVVTRVKVGLNCGYVVREIGGGEARCFSAGFRPHVFLLHRQSEMKRGQIEGRNSFVFDVSSLESHLKSIMPYMLLQCQPNASLS